LLNHAHPQNGGKADLFEAFGFRASRWTALRDALLFHARTNDVVETRTSSHGIKHAVRCNLPSPDGRSPCLTTVWIVEAGNPPRFVTAYGT